MSAQAAAAEKGEHWVNPFEKHSEKIEPVVPGNATTNSTTAKNSTVSFCICFHQLTTLADFDLSLSLSRLEDYYADHQWNDRSCCTQSRGIWSF